VDIIFGTPIIGCIVIAYFFITITAKYPFKKVKEFVVKWGEDGRLVRGYVALTLHPLAYWLATGVSVMAALVAHTNDVALGFTAHSWYVVSFVLMGWALFVNVNYTINASLMYMAAGGRF